MISIIKESDYYFPIRVSRRIHPNEITRTGKELNIDYSNKKNCFYLKCRYKGDVLVNGRQWFYIIPKNKLHTLDHSRLIPTGKYRYYLSKSKNIFYCVTSKVEYEIKTEMNEFSNYKWITKSELLSNLKIPNERWFDTDDLKVVWNNKVKYLLFPNIKVLDRLDDDDKILIALRRFSNDGKVDIEICYGGGISLKDFFDSKRINGNTENGVEFGSLRELYEEIGLTCFTIIHETKNKKCIIKIIE